VLPCTVAIKEKDDYFRTFDEIGGKIYYQRTLLELKEAQTVN
jgi:hypothetical protein